jgi:hypothetical protein
VDLGQAQVLAGDGDGRVRRIDGPPAGRGMAASPGRVSVMTPSRSPSGGTVSDRATGTEPGAATIRVAAPVSATETAK